MTRTVSQLTVLAALLGSLWGTGCAAPPVDEPFTVELEGASVWQSRNDAAVPGDMGTRFSVRDLTGSGPFASGRAYIGWQPGERHELRALAAPLSISGTGALDEAVLFDGVLFAPGTARARYRFDSYRLTYRYLLVDDDPWDLRLGFTGKLRDAEVRLSQEGISARKTDTGFVPLLHLAADYALAPDWRLSLDADGLWAPQGRALDAALKSYWSLPGGLELGFGYRTIEGGADNDDVFTFAWIHQLVASMRVTF